MRNYSSTSCILSIQYHISRSQLTQNEKILKKTFYSSILIYITCFKINITILFPKMYGPLMVFSLLIFNIAAQVPDKPAQSDGLYLSSDQIWGYGILTGVGVGLVGLLAHIILIVLKSCCTLNLFEGTIQFLYCFACGALIGDTLIDILPEAYENTNLDLRIISGTFIVSVCFFIVLERLLMSCGVSNHHWVLDKEIEIKDLDRKRNKSMENEQIKESNFKVIRATDVYADIPAQLNKNQDINPIVTVSYPVLESLFLKTRRQKSQYRAEDQTKLKCIDKWRNKESQGYLLVIGTLIHNFIGGIGMGATFSSGAVHDIISTILAVIARQVPRQLGDIAILLESQFTENQTLVLSILLNFFTLIGVIIGLAILKLGSDIKFELLVFVGGNFFYIAIDIWRHILKNKGPKAKLMNSLEFLALCAGIGSIFALDIFLP